jgi:sugar lactone lactonase YvrE
MAVLAALIDPSPVSSQTAPVLSFAGAQNTLNVGSLNDPFGVAVDTSGNVYVADSGANQVLKIPAGGGTPTSIGSGLDFPTGLAVDGNGDVFIANTFGNNIVEVPANGGSQMTIGSGLSSPLGVAVDASGDVFVADTDNNRVVEVLANGAGQVTLGSGIFAPTGVAVDGSGDVFIAASANGFVFEIPNGGSQTVVPSPELNDPRSVSVDKWGNVYIADTGNNRIVEVPANGGSPLIFGLGLSGPEGVAAVAAGGEFYVADTNNGRVVMIDGFAANLGSANVCPAGQTSPAPCSQTTTLTYNVLSAGTVGAVDVLTSGAPNLDFSLASNTCKGALKVGSCAVTVKFAPRAPGQRKGAVELIYGSGTAATLVASTLIYGEGEGPAVAYGPGIQTTIATGLDYPDAVAVDGKGDVFIANPEANEVVEIPAGGTPTSFSGGFSAPSGIAVDGAGNVYVSNAGGSNNVTEVLAVGGAQVQIGRGLSGPLGVAVDAMGDVFIVDSNNGRVVEVPVNGGAQTTIVSDLNPPLGVAVDAAGDVFVSTYLGEQVVEIPAGGGYETIASGLKLAAGLAVDAAGDVFVGDYFGVTEISPNGAQTTIGTGLGSPEGVAVDASGNIFIADTDNNRVVKLNRSTAPSFNFTSTVNLATTAKSVTFLNIGNQALNAVTPGITFGNTDFEQVPGSGSPADCSTTFSLVPGASCNLSIIFKPAAAGTVTSTATLTDNALNGVAAKQNINLNGVGTPPITPTVEVTGGPFVYNGHAQTASCKATGTGGAAVSGSCTFTYNGGSARPINAGTYTVVATFTSTNPHYTNATGTGSLVINIAPLTITANGAVYLQGGTFPTLTVSYSGFVDGQTTSVLKGMLKITTTATSTSPLGNYPIVPSGLMSTNYAITYVDGTLAVLPSTGLEGFTYHIQNVNSGLYVGVAGASTSNGADLVQWTPDTSLDQDWQFILLKNGAYQILDVNSELLVGVLGASTTEGAAVVQWSYTGSTDQEWQLTPVGSNWLITDVNSGLQMAIQGNSTTAGGQVIQWPANGTTSQLFTLIQLQ